MKLVRPFACVTLVAMMFIRVASAKEACFPVSNGSSLAGKEFHARLAYAWSDAKILKELGLDMRRAKISRSVGVDGTGTTYRFRDSVVRINLGVEKTVLFSSKPLDADVVWDLCPPEAANSPNSAFQATPSA